MQKSKPFCYFKLYLKKIFPSYFYYKLFEQEQGDNTRKSI